MKLILSFFIIIFSLCSYAQIENKLPRVLEMEEKLEMEASKYFSQRFPGQPYFIKVEVIPLRSDISRAAKGAERLPYLEYETEDFVDDWDDPNVSISHLRNRVKKINFEIDVSTKMSSGEIQEIKDSIISFLKLIPFRDEIKVEKKLNNDVPVPEFAYYLAAGLAVMLLGVGLWLRMSVGFIAKNVKGNNQENAGGSVQTSSPMMSSSGGGDSQLSVKEVPPIRGDINFFDPIKLLEVLHLKIKQVVQNPGFPTLQDMIILEKLADYSTGCLGALVSEFPSDIQKTIFQLGKSQKWLEAFSFPTQVDQKAFQALEEISRSRDMKKSDRDWQNLLIQMWRLDDHLVSFLKEINPEHAFVILAQLPKNISLKIGKKAYPGSWGRVLEDERGNVIIEPNLVKEYYKKAVSVVPVFEYQILDSYRKEKEILDYVRTASIEDERDIYETLSSDSFIVKTRIPFYKIFELNDESFKKMSDKFSINDWTVALLNSSRQYIKRYADSLDDKQRYVFSMTLKRMDESSINKMDQVLMRERMAKVLNEFKAEAKEDINLAKPEVGNYDDSKTA